MWCPSCQSDKTAVICTDKSHVVERYRKCKVCHFTFPTIESVKFDPELQEHAQYSDEEVARILKKRHSHQKDLFHE